jgi:autotransporter translocation and assembly factor TamB
MARPRTIIFTAAGLLLGVLLLAIGAGAVLTQTDRGRGLLRQTLLPVARAAIPGELYVGRIGGSTSSRPTARPFCAPDPYNSNTTCAICSTVASLCALPR